MDPVVEALLNKMLAHLDAIEASNKAMLAIIEGKPVDVMGSGESVMVPKIEWTEEEVEAYRDRNQQ